MENQTFILASASPRRKEILQSIGIDTIILPSNAEENMDQHILPDMLVQQLALLKAADVAKGKGSGYYVIGADTVVYDGSHIMGKPKSAQHAAQILQQLAGNWHEVYTGIAVVNTTTGKGATRVECSRVHFKTLDEAEIAAYIETGEYQDKAGGYGIQGKGAMLVDRIEGDYFNIVGFPVSKFYDLLKEEFEENILAGNL